jgi:hypothetical protein
MAAGEELQACVGLCGGKEVGGKSVRELPEKEGSGMKKGLWLVASA